MKIGKVKIIIVLALSLALLKLTLVTPRRDGVESPFAVRQVWASAHHPEGIVMNIPSNYIDGNVMWFEPIVEAQRKKAGDKLPKFKETELLHVLWPGMEPMTPSNRKDFVVAGGGRAISILLITSSRRPDVDLTMAIISGRIDYTFGRKKKLDELVSYEPWVQTSYRDDLGLVQVIGLSKGIPGGIFPPSEGRGRIFDDDIFFKKNGKDYVTGIFCTELPPPEKEKYIEPQCEQFFEVEKIEVTVTLGYRRKYLKDWSVIQNKITNLLLSFAGNGK